MKTLVATLVLAATTLSLGACASDAAKVETKADVKTDVRAASVNATCPYSGKGNNPDITSVFESKQIGFCCNGCKSRFDAATPEGKRVIMAKAMKQ